MEVAWGKKEKAMSGEGDSPSAKREKLVPSQVAELDKDLRGRNRLGGQHISC